MIELLVSRTELSKAVENHMLVLALCWNHVDFKITK